jgi:hypothetical protein
MRVRITAVAALAGSLFLAPVMMGQANATVPDLKGVFGTTDGDVTLVRHGGGGHGGGGMRGGGGGVVAVTTTRVGVVVDTLAV